MSFSIEEMTVLKHMVAVYKPKSYNEELVVKEIYNKLENGDTLD